MQHMESTEIRDPSANTIAAVKYRRSDVNLGMQQFQERNQIDMESEQYCWTATNTAKAFQFPLINKMALKRNKSFNTDWGWGGGND